ncbi:MAG: hypothetical protein HZA22_00030 [Nitrospirae bacterium]|nr:hypothetical protein [Nitrospirota bacterium]
MPDENALITEDRAYKPSSPGMPERRFLIETEGYRWEVMVWRYTVRETGSVVFRAVAEGEHASYGFTVNEALNDLKAIMLLRLAAGGGRKNTVSLDEVRSFLDPMDAAREDIKLAEALSRKPLIARVLGL